MPRLENEIIHMLRRLVRSHPMWRIHHDLHTTTSIHRLGDEIVLVELPLQHTRPAPRATHAVAKYDLFELARAPEAHLDGTRFEEDNVGRDGRDGVDRAVPLDDVDGAPVAVYKETEC